MLVAVARALTALMAVCITEMATKGVEDCGGTIFDGAVILWARALY